MDWKREAVDKLKCYEAKRQALKSIPEEMHRLELQITGIRSAASDGTPVSGGGSGREDALINSISRRVELDLALGDAKRWVETVDNALAVLNDDERKVLDRFYIHRSRGAVERLREELGLQDVSSVYRRKDRALRHFTYALYGVAET